MGHNPTVWQNDVMVISTVELVFISPDTVSDIHSYSWSLTLKCELDLSAQHLCLASGAHSQLQNMLYNIINNV